MVRNSICLVNISQTDLIWFEFKIAVQDSWPGLHVHDSFIHLLHCSAYVPWVTLGHGCAQLHQYWSNRLLTHEAAMALGQRRETEFWRGVWQTVCNLLLSADSVYSLCLVLLNLWNLKHNRYPFAEKLQASESNRNWWRSELLKICWWIKTLTVSSWDSDIHHREDTNRFW